MSFFKTNFHSINLPPLLSVNACFIAGIIAHNNPLLLCMLFALIISCICFAYVQKNNAYKQLILYFFAMALGTYLHHKEWHDYRHFYTLIHDKKFTVMGTVIDIYDTNINHKQMTAIVVAIDTININATTNIAKITCHTRRDDRKTILKWGPHSACNKEWGYNKLYVFYTHKNKSLRVADCATFYNVTCKLPSSKDFQRYQIKEQIVATSFDDRVAYKTNHRPIWSLRYWLWYQKNRLLNALEDKLSPECFRFFTSLFLGNRAVVKNELEETNEQFKTWGISHFLARSGLHLVIFIFIWQALFSVIPLPLCIKQIILLLISCTYFIFTWTSAPFTRSFALFIFNKFCLLGKIQFHLLHYLILTCFLFLLCCPLYLFFLDFQLSFALTFALAWLNQVTPYYTK